MVGRVACSLPLEPLLRVRGSNECVRAMCRLFDDVFANDSRLLFIIKNIQNIDSMPLFRACVPLCDMYTTVMGIGLYTPSSIL